MKVVAHVRELILEGEVRFSSQQLEAALERELARVEVEGAGDKRVAQMNVSCRTSLADVARATRLEIVHRLRREVP
jgi:hypothetical protein